MDGLLISLVEGTHLVYEFIRQFWWVFMVGWLVFWGWYSHTRKDREVLVWPLLTIVAGLVFGVVGTVSVYDAVRDPANFESGILSCDEIGGSEERAICEEDNWRSAQHHRQLAVYVDEPGGEIHLLRTFLNAFADKVAAFQITLIWLAAFYLLSRLFFRRKTPEKPERDVIRI